ncbi:MAG: hypothetical protein L0229_15225 [Blastocatellia bacterium]|nr:hypothetical protein [Blastocatellia bacterium]
MDPKEPSKVLSEANLAGKDTDTTPSPLHSYERIEERLSVEEFIKREQALSDIALREKALNFLIRAFGVLLICTILIIIFQGFHIGGFSLEPDFLKWLGIATVGEVATLLTIAIGSLFKRRS